MQELLEQVRLGGDVDALAQLQRRLLRGRPVAAGAGDHEALVLRDGQPLAGEPLGDRVRQPGDVLAAQRRQRRDGAGVGGRVAVALLDLGRATTTSSQSAAIGPSGFAVTSHFGPANARAASSVSGVPPSWLTSTSTSASGGASTASSASTPFAARLGGVERRAAADGRDASVRQPRVGRHLGQPLGLRRDRLPHLLARHGCLYTMAGDGGLRAPLAVERPAGADRADAARAVGLLLRHARRRLALRDGGDERDRALRRAHVLQGHRAAADGARHRRRDRLRSAASSTPSPARSTRATTSAAPPRRATRRSTCSSTCSATPSFDPRRSSARRA